MTSRTYEIADKVQPVLEYGGCSAWDPHRAILIDTLDMAARFVTSNYSYKLDSATNNLQQLKWTSLKEIGLILLYNGLKMKPKYNIRSPYLDKLSRKQICWIFLCPLPGRIFTYFQLHFTEVLY